MNPIINAEAVNTIRLTGNNSKDIADRLDVLLSYQLPFDFIHLEAKMINIPDGVIKIFEKMAHDFWKRVANDERLLKEFKKHLRRGNPLKKGYNYSETFDYDGYNLGTLAQRSFNPPF